MKFCHLSAAVRANVRWKVEENRQACFPRTITANFMTVFADMFPADLWFAKAAFILLSLCWAATTISRRQQCLFLTGPIILSYPTNVTGQPSKASLWIYGDEMELLHRETRLQSQNRNLWKALLQPQLLHFARLAAETEVKSFFPQGLAPAPWLCPCSPRGAELRLCCQPSSLGSLLPSPVVTLDHQTPLASLFFSVITNPLCFLQWWVSFRWAPSPPPCAVISIMKSRAWSTARQSHFQCFSYLRSHHNVAWGNSALVAPTIIHVNGYSKQKRQNWAQNNRFGKAQINAAVSLL